MQYLLTLCQNHLEEYFPTNYYLQRLFYCETVHGK